MKKFMFAILALIFLGVASSASALEAIEDLGKSIFFDLNLSINKNQSCATCHGPEAGWTGPDLAINEGGTVYEGSIPDRFGNRKPPSAAYATQSPIFHQDKKGLFVGGNFWDGRATGDKLGSPAADQAQGPFLNPMEQALPDSACVVYRVCKPVVSGDYPVSLKDVWGDGVCDIDWPANIEDTCSTEEGTVTLSVDDKAKSDIAYDYIALSIAAYEASPEVNAFSSKYDKTFKNIDKAKAKLTQEEQRGYALFRGKGMCHRCHTGNGQKALFTDYTFDNLGIPKNPDNPFYTMPAEWNADGINWIDPGLGGFLQSEAYDEAVYMAEWGKHKVPTVRNVGKGSCEAEPDNPLCISKAYGHNGYFKSLEGIVHFYNTRDTKDECPGAYTEAQALTADCWPAPEVAENVNTAELGDLGLSADEEAAIVAFLKTLSDGYTPKR